MTGRSEYNRQDGSLLAWIGAVAIALAFITGLVQFVNPACSWPWVVSGGLMVGSMISAMMWLEWYQR